MSHQSTRPPRWPVVAMVASWLLGILWIVAYYLNPTLPVLIELGNWNLIVGFALFGLGWVFLLIFVVSAITAARRR